MNLVDIEGMIHLAETNPGMKDLLDQALEYYILKGKPAGPKIFRERKESRSERDFRIMNTRYGL